MLRLAGFAFALILSLLSAPSAFAQDPADAAAYKGYTLSMDKLNRFLAAVTAATKAAEADPAFQEEIDAMMEEPDDTIAEKRAQYSGHPKIFAFFQQQGLTMDDVVIGPTAAAYAMAVAANPNPGPLMEFVTPAQVAFARQNQAALQQFFMVLPR
jgi:hypothetical protein